MRKISILILVFTIIFVVVAPFYIGKSDIFGKNRYYSPLQIKRFSSYSDLKSFLEAKPQISPYYRVGLKRSVAGILSKSYGITGPLTSFEFAFPDHSKTNVQVEGVDEADVVKTDGEFIYVISGTQVVILKAYPAEDAEILSQIRLNGALKGTFINGDKLVLFEEKSPRTFIKVYDISDRENPLLARNVSLDGWYFDSRMIGEYVYTVINKPANLFNGEVSLPKVYSSDDVEEISASEIYYTDAPDYFYTFTTIVAINVQNDEEPSHETLLVGTTHEMYVSLNNIYITFREFERTLIYRIHVEGSEISYAACGAVPGYVLNQFSMDEHEGYFRIATTTGHINRNLEEATARNHVYVLDMNLAIVGKLEDLALGEKIYSARFMGDRCYLVTFRKVDPLFVIDLEDPHNPIVLGELKITGYSDYLHPYDANHIIGIGKETVAAEMGDFAWYQGVKISLFDVSDVGAPKEIAKYEIGDRGTNSPILKDHKALLFDKSKNLLVIPVLVAQIDKEKYPNEVPPNARGRYVWQGAYVFDITLENGIVLKGRITHIGSEGSGMDSMFSSSYSVKRSLYIGNVLYTISDSKIKMNNLETLEEINEVELPP
jgi:uncharacterized secreted protein with C-terminal beta-propeller domain